MKLSIIIPVYNEAATITEILNHVGMTPYEKEILVVDDGSTDGTKERLQSYGKGEVVKVFYHPKNQGKGAAIRTALPHATGNVVLIQDADLEYDPQDYAGLLGPIEKGAADVVYGSRLSSAKPQRVYLFWHKAGNILLTLITNILYNTTLTDMECGYKVFRREVIQSLPLRANGFAFEPEVTAKVLKRGYRLFEVPISYYGRSYKEGKKITWRHGFEALWCLVLFRLMD